MLELGLSDGALEKGKMGKSLKAEGVQIPVCEGFGVRVRRDDFVVRELGIW